MVDATGQVLLPGFVDLHTHLREPGREYAEDIETGSAAAALGGYTAVFAMANTDPVADSAVVTDHVWHRGQQVGLVDVHPVGAVTVGLEGTQLTEMGLMAAGVGRVRMFSDDGDLRRRPAGDAARPGVRHRPRRAHRAARRGATADRRRRRARGPQRRAARALRAGRAPRRSRSSPATRCSPATPGPACTSATPRPRAPSSSSDGPRSKAFRSPPRSPRTTCCSTIRGWPATTAATG